MLPWVQGAFLNLGGAIGLALLDNTWARVRWDGKICIAAGGGAPRSEETTIPVEAPFMSPGAWEALDSELSSDSEMRLLCVVTRVSAEGFMEWVSPVALVYAMRVRYFPLRQGHSQRACERIICYGNGRRSCPCPSFTPTAS